jgi:hypothetical protein
LPQRIDRQRRIKKKPLGLEGGLKWTNEREVVRRPELV